MYEFDFNQVRIAFQPTCGWEGGKLALEIFIGQVVPVQRPFPSKKKNNFQSGRPRKMKIQCERFGLFRLARARYDVTHTPGLIALKQKQK